MPTRTPVAPAVVAPAPDAGVPPQYQEAYASGTSGQWYERVQPQWGSGFGAQTGTVRRSLPSWLIVGLVGVGLYFLFRR